MRVLVTGGAGFIGSNLVDRLLAAGHAVVAYDNLSTGSRRFLEHAASFSSFRLIEGDVFDAARLREAMAGCDFVYHLAANADVRFGIDRPGRDLEQNTLGTHHVLEAMRHAEVRDIAFSSTGSVYGESPVIPTPEDAPFPIQTSLYAASKLAGEALISAYCEGFGMRAWLFRFVSVLGERYTHGHVFDFYKKLMDDPAVLRVLGDGHQKKSYMYVQDCIDAMFLAVERARNKVNLFNLGFPDYIEVNDSIACITRHLGISPRLEYAGGERGWVGDNPFIFLDVSRIQTLGWTPKVPIRDAVIRTLRWLQDNRWVCETRS